MTTQHAPPRWYLIQCTPGQDSRAEENLMRQAFKCYRPTQQVERLLRGHRITQHTDQSHRKDLIVFVGDKLARDGDHKNAIAGKPCSDRKTLNSEANCFASLLMPCS